eukprot:COSAG04_NODE_2381_length_4233_cov_38.831640_4_plen_233_part_00
MWINRISLIGFLQTDETEPSLGVFCLFRQRHVLKKAVQEGPLGQAAQMARHVAQGARRAERREERQLQQVEKEPQEEQAEEERQRLAQRWAELIHLVVARDRQEVEKQPSKRRKTDAIVPSSVAPAAATLRLRELTVEQVGTFVFNVLTSRDIDESIAETCKGYLVEQRIKGSELPDYEVEDLEKLGSAMTAPHARKLRTEVERIENGAILLTAQCVPAGGEKRKSTTIFSL